MKRIIFPIIASLLLAVSCELETSDNGDLDGYWVLMNVDTISTGGSKYVAEELNTWSFQFNSLQIRSHGGALSISKFTHTADSLIVYDVYDSYSDTLLSPKKLSAAGINAIPARFRVSLLTEHRLQLTDSFLILNLEKY